MLSTYELRSVSRRAVVGAIIFALALLAGIQVANAAEIVPSVGLTKSVDGGDKAAGMGGLAFRGHLGPLMPEIALGYRVDERFDGDLKVRMWPVTTSLYFSPISMLYAGAGVGWYHTTFDFDETIPLKDETRQEFGVHLGGGVQIPLGSRVGVDLSGRYVMMRDQDSHLVPEKFDPDFWSTQLGLAIKL